MSHLFKKQIVRYVGPNGKRCPKDAPGAKRVDEKSTKWYGRYRTPAGIVRTVALYTDKAASRTELTNLVKQAERLDSGLADPFAEHRKTPLSGHLAEFRKNLTSNHNTDKYIHQTLSRCQAVFSGCGFTLLGHLKAEKVSNWLKSRFDEATLAKRRWDELSAEDKMKTLKPESFGIASCNHYITAVKNFGNWLEEFDRMEKNPFGKKLPHLNAKVDVRVERRALATEELAWLVYAAESSKKPFRGLSGPDRALLYLVAASTGLRANEMASLTPASFDLQSKPPTVTIEAANEKAGRGATLTLPSFVAVKLHPWLTRRRQTAAASKAKPITDTLWPGIWSKKAAEMFRRDLAEARAIWLSEVESIAEELQQRTASSFLTPVNERGEVADFHALRHTFITQMLRSGAKPKVAQKAARHSTFKLTMDKYGHLMDGDEGEAVEALPSFDEPKRLTSGDSGAGGATTGLVALPVALAGDDSCESMMTDDESSLMRAAPDKRGVPMKTSVFQGVFAQDSNLSRLEGNGLTVL